MAEPPDLSGFGNLAGMFDPQMMANLQTQSVLGGAAQGLLSAGGPSPYPIDIGTALGRGIGGAVQGQQEMPWMRQLGAMMQMRQMAVESSIMQHVMSGGGIPGLTDSGQAPADTGGGQAPGSPQMPATGTPTPLVQTASGAENPYNIGNVEAPKGSSTRFAQPQSWGEGVGLTIDNARSYPGKYNGGKPMSIQQIAQRWTEDNKGPWAFNVARGSGLPADQPIDLTDPMTAAKFARGVHLAEKDQKSSPIQPVDAYLPGAQGPTLQMPRSAGQQVAQSGTAADGAPAGMPPPPARIPIPPVVQSMLLSPRFKAMGEAAVKEIDRRNDRNMELYKMDPRVKAAQTSAEGYAGVGPATAKAVAEQQATGPGKVELARQTSEAEKHYKEGRAPYETPKVQGYVASLPELTQAEFNSRLASGDFKGAQETLDKATGGMPLEWLQIKGPELLNKLPPSIQGVMAGLLDGSIPVADLEARGAQTTGFGKNALLNIAKRIDPEFDTASGASRHTFQTYLASGQGQQMLSSLNVAPQHMLQYRNLMLAKQNHDSQLFNSVRDYINRQLGHPEITSAEAMENFLATETARAVHGAGALGERTVEEAQRLIGTNQAPQQNIGVLDNWSKALGARIGFLEHQAKRFKIPESTYGQFMMPETKSAMDELHKQGQGILPAEKLPPTIGNHTVDPTKYDYRRHPQTGAWQYMEKK